jgi:hypothetical protein
MDEPRKSKNDRRKEAVVRLGIAVDQIQEVLRLMPETYRPPADLLNLKHSIERVQDDLWEATQAEPGGDAQGV